MRVISPAAQAILDQPLGAEPIFVIEVQWVADGPWIPYADRRVETVPGRILQVSGLDDIVQISKGSQSQQISVTLDDTDGSIKAILDANDIHKRPCKVYQLFHGLDLSDKFLLFRGQVSSPLEWNEGDRTVRFDVITRIEDAEVGFSAEEGNFPGIPEDLVGQAWPLVFGTCVNVPALKITSPRRGVLKGGFGILDPTLQPRLNQLRRTCCPITWIGWEIRQDTPLGWGGTTYRFVPQYAPDAQCECNKKAQILALEQEIAAQVPFQNTVVGIVDGHKFPQNTLLTLKVNGAIITGRFSGDNFTIVSRAHPDSGVSIPPPKTFICPAEDPAATNNTSNNSLPVCIIDTGQLSQSSTGGTQSVKSWAYLESFPTSSFFWAEAGSEVFLANDETVVYVANIIESDIIRVSAYRRFPSGVRQLTTVPTSYYATRISDFNGYDVTEIVMPKLLSLRGEGWEDDIYVTLESEVGPNTVDIIEWLIGKYAPTLGVDTGSFDDVRNKIDNYPMNFPLLQRVNLIQLLEDIAFQARCALFLNDDVFQIRYLAEEPTPVDDVTASDVLANSLALSHTPTEDLVTKLVAEWKYDHAIDKPNKVILRNNIARYGTHEQVFDFFCFNIQSLVTKSATYWSIRLSNTWRIAKFQTPINKLALEVFDPVMVDLGHLTDEPIIGLVEQATYNSDDSTIDFSVWTPVRSGERTPYDFAFPAGIAVENVYPSAVDVEQGVSGSGGPNLQITPPTGHVLGQYQGLIQGAQLGNGNPCLGPSGTFLGVGSECYGDRGDRNPSDIDDEKPSVSTIGTDISIPSSRDPVAVATEAARKVEELKNKANTQAVNTREQTEKAINSASGGSGGGSNPGNSGGGQGGGDQTSDNDPQKMQDFLNSLPEIPETECYAAVTITWCPNVEAVTSGGTVASCPGGCPPGNCNEVIRVNSQAAAQAIFEAARARVLSPATIGSPHPTASGISKNMPSGCGEPNEQAIIGYTGVEKMEGKGSGSQGIIGGGS